jgi:hypothetical protein
MATRVDIERLSRRLGVKELEPRSPHGREPREAAAPKDDGLVTGPEHPPDRPTTPPSEGSDDT